MVKESRMIDEVQKAAKQRVIFLPHAILQMTRPDRMIEPSEVRMVIDKGVMVEDYPEDVRGHSCLILGFGYNKRPIHVVCAPKKEYLAIITAYLPDPKEWSPDFTERVQR